MVTDWRTSGPTSPAALNIHRPCLSLHLFYFDSLNLHSLHVPRNRDKTSTRITQRDNRLYACTIPPLPVFVTRGVVGIPQLNKPRRQEIFVSCSTRRLWHAQRIAFSAIVPLISDISPRSIPTFHCPAGRLGCHTLFDTRVRIFH